MLPSSISIVAALGRNGVIGRKGRLPWDYIRADMSRFRRLTVGKIILMGRLTHESIGKPLKDRLNIVVSRDPDYKSEGCVIVPSIACGLVFASSIEEPLMVVGGATVYKQVMDLDVPLTFHLTLVDVDVEGDTFFPPINLENWKVTRYENYKKDNSSPYDLEFVTACRT